MTPENKVRSGMRPLRARAAARAAWVLIVMFCSGACGSIPTPAPTAGIEGHVLIGPMCPVIQADTPCPDQPYQAKLLIQDSRGRPVAEFETDALGQFRLPLPPGDYVILPQSPDGFTRAPQQPVTVAAGAFTQVTITYDSGIR